MSLPAATAPRARSLCPVLLASLLLTGGCATLPSSGPTAKQVLASTAGHPILPAKIVDISPATLSQVDATAPSRISLAALAAPSTVGRIGQGDILQITVFEIGTTLFSGGSAGLSTSDDATPTAAGHSLPLIVVDGDGNIDVPYVGVLRVAGETPRAVEGMILQGMIGLSQRAQVVVTVRESVTDTVFLLGGVKTPGRVPLTLTHEHLLDAIALAGGALSAPQDITVRLTRDGRSAEANLDGLRAGTPDDVVLLPGDRIELLASTRSFTVFGATDKVSEIPFSTSSLTLAQAVARAGGPTDRQADPSAVFVFRWSPATQPDGAPVPVIYRLNMLRPESYFLAQRFFMRSGDVIYIANARSNQAVKLVQIINQLFSPFYGVRELTR